MRKDAALRSLSRITLNTADRVLKARRSPLDYMLRIMWDETVAPERRDQMAIAAAPYVHARLAQVRHVAEDNSGLGHLLLAEKELAAAVLGRVKRAEETKVIDVSASQTD